MNLHASPSSEPGSPIDSIDGLLAGFGRLDYISDRRLATVAYLAASLLFGLYFLWKAIAFLQRDRREVAARKLFFTSIAYLPLQLGVLVADRMINF